MFPKYPKLLFPDIPKHAHKDMERLHAILLEVLPLNGRHRKELPYNIRDLSRMLTSDRSDLARDYMGTPTSVSGYLYFFFPWNIYRQVKLFTGLGINIEDDAYIVDVGTGPLTMVVALWLACPHLRDKKLRFYCMDRSPKIARIGLEIFKRLSPESPWRIELAKGNIGHKFPERADVFFAANVFNELSWVGTNQMEEKTSLLARWIAKSTKKNSQLCIIEPGTRIGGQLISYLRESFMDEGFYPLAPCTHCEECPLMETERKSWCHFVFSAISAPRWLRILSERAKLLKETASLSFIHMQKTDFEEQSSLYVRALSGAFSLERGTGQYGCGEKGLTLLRYKNNYGYAAVSGSSILANFDDKKEIDEVSGAIIMDVKQKIAEAESVYKPVLAEDDAEIKKEAMRQKTAIDRGTDTRKDDTRKTYTRKEEDNQRDRGEHKNTGYRKDNKDNNKERSNSFKKDFAPKRDRDADFKKDFAPKRDRDADFRKDAPLRKNNESERDLKRGNRFNKENTHGTSTFKKDFSAPAKRNNDRDVKDEDFKKDFVINSEQDGEFKKKYPPKSDSKSKFKKSYNISKKKKSR